MTRSRFGCLVALAVLAALLLSGCTREGARYLDANAKRPGNIFEPEPELEADLPDPIDVPVDPVDPDVAEAFCDTTCAAVAELCDQLDSLDDCLGACIGALGRDASGAVAYTCWEVTCDASVCFEPTGVHPFCAEACASDDDCAPLDRDGWRENGGAFCVAACTGAVVEEDAPTCDSPTAAQSARDAIRAAVEDYTGQCPCPYSRKRNGSRCGGTSAWSRGGGAAPVCYRWELDP